MFACGNVVHVNDLADNVSIESELAGKYAAMYAAGTLPEAKAQLNVIAGEGVRYVCPHHVAVTDEEEVIRLYFRVSEPGRKTILKARSGKKEIAAREVRRVSPGEMDHIDIHTQDLTGDDVVICAEGVKKG